MVWRVRPDHDPNCWLDIKPIGVEQMDQMVGRLPPDAEITGCPRYRDLQGRMWPKPAEMWIVKEFQD